MKYLQLVYGHQMYTLYMATDMVTVTAMFIYVYTEMSRQSFNIILFDPTFPLHSTNSPQFFITYYMRLA